MTSVATNQVSSTAAAVGAPALAYPSTWQPCPTVLSADATTDKAIRVRMHDGGFLTARRPKERFSP